MLKNVIAPLQAWLLSQDGCVGCGMPLAQAEKRQAKAGMVVTCKCKRMYIFDMQEKQYRRALLTEL